MDVDKDTLNGREDPLNRHEERFRFWRYTRDPCKGEQMNSQDEVVKRGEDVVVLKGDTTQKGIECLVELYIGQKVLLLFFGGFLTET